MTCKQMEALLTRYILGDLDAADRAGVEAHLAECPACRAEAEVLRPTVDLLRQALTARSNDTPRLDPVRRANILASVRRRKPAVTWIRPVLKAAAVFAILLVFAGLFLPAVTSVRGRTKSSAISAARAREQAVKLGLDMYEVDHGRKPQTAADLSGYLRDQTVVSDDEVQRLAAGERASAAPAAEVPAKPAPGAASGATWASGVEKAAAEAESAPLSGPVTLSLKRPSSARRVEALVDALRRKEDAPAGGTFGDLNNTVDMPPAPTAPQPGAVANGVEVQRLAAGEIAAFGGALRSDHPRNEEVSKMNEPAPSRDSDGDTYGAGGGGSTLKQKKRLGGRDAGVLTERAADELRSAVAIKGLPGGGSGKAAEVLSGNKSEVLVERSLFSLPSAPEPATVDASDRRSSRSDAKESRVVAKSAAATSQNRLSAAATAPTDKAKREAPGWTDGRDRAVVAYSLDAWEGGGRQSSVAAPAETAALVSETKPPKQEAVKASRAPAPAEEAPVVEPVYPPQVFSPIVDCKQSPFSTFGIDVDTASFTLARRSLLQGKRPPEGAIRVEEFVNAFEYAYRAPERDTFAVYADRARSPFRPSMELLRIGVRGKVIGRDRMRPSVLTFVIDTSGSMNTPDRLELIRKSLGMLVDHLGPQDAVSIVSFGSEARLVLDQAGIAQRDAIRAALNGLQTYGSTHLEGGLRLAYEVAARNFRGGAINRVLLLSDGVANLGASTAGEILAQVERQRKQGIYCSVFGFGQGAYNDTMLEALADKGDGVYRFVDSLAEARRVFVDDLAATLCVIAKDVKIQVQFDPERVARYRQIGYENRRLEKEQFRDDTVDAGEVGAGQSATALYEVQLTGNPVELLGIVRLRWKDAETGKVEERAFPIKAGDRYASFEAAPVRFRLAAGVAEFADLLRRNPYTAGTTVGDVAAVLRPVALELNLDAQVQDLLRMAGAAAAGQ